jgi:hypothetical protein
MRADHQPDPKLTNPEPAGCFRLTRPLSRTE